MPYRRMPNSAALSSICLIWRAAHLIQDRQVRIVGGCAVVERRDGAVGAVYRQPAPPQPVEGLRRGHFVYQVQIDVQHRRALRFLGHQWFCQIFSNKVCGVCMSLLHNQHHAQVDFGRLVFGFAGRYQHLVQRRQVALRWPR